MDAYRTLCDIFLQVKESGYAEEELREILKFRAARRGLELPDAVQDYLMTRTRRSPGDLLATLARLDAASLRAKRALTVPFVREALDD